MTPQTHLLLGIWYATCSAHVRSKYLPPVFTQT